MAKVSSLRCRALNVSAMQRVAPPGLCQGGKLQLLSIPKKKKKINQTGNEVLINVIKLYLRIISSPSYTHKMEEKKSTSTYRRHFISVAGHNGGTQHLATQQFITLIGFLQGGTNPRG